jgi:carbon monoxide dehydrogenase subunit G
MRRLEASIRVQQPAETVFDFMSVAENHARFIPNMVEFRQTSPGAFGQVGTTIRGRLRILGVSVEVPYEITQFEPKTRLAMQGVMGPILFKDGYALEPAGGETRIVFWLELTPRGVARLANPLMGFIGRTHAAETLANLKKALETAG